MSKGVFIIGTMQRIVTLTNGKERITKNVTVIKQSDLVLVLKICLQALQVQNILKMSK